MNFSGKTILVTGANGGCGKAISKAFLKAGGTVVATDIVIPTWDDKEYNDNLIKLKMNVADEENVNKVVNSIIERTKEIHILVNNAGISYESPVHLTSLESWNKVMSVNATGTFLCSRAVIKNMLENNIKGSIINISSIAGRNAFPNSSAYSASKAAIIGFTRSLAAELGQYDITVNAICPGSVDTPMIEKVIQNISSKTGMSLEDTRKMMEDSIPMKRFQKPEDVAALVMFLASPFGRNINGETINLDGGVVRN